MAKLIFSGEKFGGRVYEILAHRTTVGRSDENTLSIRDSSISERHCEIYDNGTDLIVRDLGSRNGTVVNGELLRDAQRPLAHGQVVKFGAIEARLEMPASASSDTVTDVTAVHFHAKSASAPPPVHPTPATLAAGTVPSSDEHTLLLPRTEVEAPQSSVAPPEVPPRRRHSLLVVMLVGLGLALLIWAVMAR